LQKGVEFLGNLCARTRHWTRITAPVAGTIVGADTGKPRNLRLHVFPLNRNITESGFENNRWTSLAGTVDFEPVAADIY
jgi:hypothetical protein